MLMAKVCLRIAAKPLDVSKAAKQGLAVAQYDLLMVIVSGEERPKISPRPPLGMKKRRLFWQVHLRERPRISL
jgi:hypothetical protein